MRAWSQACRDDGQVVVGVHTPEVSFEHDIDHVRRASEERAIDYPVAVDNSYAIWNAFNNHYWPALYSVDRDGRIRDEHFGEGRYEQSERIGTSPSSSGDVPARPPAERRAHSAARHPPRPRVGLPRNAGSQRAAGGVCPTSTFRTCQASGTRRPRTGSDGREPPGFDAYWRVCWAPPIPSTTPPGWVPDSCWAESSPPSSTDVASPAR